MNIILNAVVGSRAYGLDTPDSDTDTLGVFVAPTVDVAGLDWSPRLETVTDASPDGDDTTLHEVGKFVRILLQNNPTVTEILFSKKFTEYTDWGQRLIDLRDHVLYTEGVRKAFAGYAENQLRRAINTDNSIRRYKTFRTALRVARQGQKLLDSEEIILEVPNPDDYFELEHMSLGAAYHTVRPEIDRLYSMTSYLREEPDRQVAADLLKDIRREYIG